MPITTPRLRGILPGAGAVLACLLGLFTGCGERESADRGGPSTTPAPALAPESAPEPAPTPTQTTTAEGLTLTDLTPGDGEPVPGGASVTIEFTAWIVGDDAPFDSTERRRRPLAFSLESAGLIAGLRRGIEGMRIGGTRRIEIPAALGYGATGRHPVPPEADLIYEVTLIDWRPGPE